MLIMIRCPNCGHENFVTCNKNGNGRLSCEACNHIEIVSVNHMIGELVEAI